MKKILIIISFMFLMTSLYADSSRDLKVVDEYQKVASLLAYGTYEMRDYPDANKYLLRAIEYMKKNKMNMNSFKAADIYNSLAYVSVRWSGINTTYYDDSQLSKKWAEHGLEHINESIKYAEKSYKIMKKLGKGYEKSAQDIKSLLDKNKRVQKKLEKKLSTF